MNEQKLNELFKESEGCYVDYTKKLLKEANDIINKFPEEKKIQALNEYKKLQQKIKDEILEDKKIIKEELELIKSDISDINSIYTKEKSFFKSSIEKVNNIKIEKELKKIYWNDFLEKWFNKEKKVIHWYDWFRWNYAIKKSEFEYILVHKNIKNVNSIAFANYLLLLNEEKNLNINYLYTKLWNKGLEDLLEIWEKDYENKTAFKKLNGTPQWKKIINIIKSFNNIEDFIKLKNIDKNDKTSIIDILETEKKNLKNEYISKIKETYYKDNPYLTDEKKEKFENKLNKDFTELIHKTDSFDINNFIKNNIDFFKKYSIPISDMPALVTLEIKIHEIWNKINEITYEKQLEELEQRKNELENIPNRTNEQQKELEEVNQKINLRKKQTEEIKTQSTQFEINKSLISNLTNDDYELIFNLENTATEILKEKAKWNKELQALLNQYEKNLQIIKNNKDQEKDESNLVDINTNKSIKNDFNTFKNEIFYNLESWNTIIKQSNKLFLQKDWEKISITQEEAKIIAKNKVAENNLINFKNILKDLNLSKMWEIRHGLFSRLSQKWHFSINDGDYLKENERKIFFKSIMKSIWQNIDNLEEGKDIIQSIKDYNLENNFVKTKEYTRLWSRIENEFIEKFSKTNSLNNLNFLKFENSLNNKIYRPIKKDFNYEKQKVKV